MQRDDFDYDLFSFDLIDVLFICCWILIILSIIWSYKIAKQTGRDPGVWIFIGIILGPIGLLVLSLKDFYIKNPALRNEIVKTRLEYRNELKNVMFEIETEQTHTKGFKKKLLDKYNTVLIERAAKVLTNDKINTLKELIDIGIINSRTDLSNKKKLIEILEYNKLKDSDIYNWKPEWIEDESVCPACGTKLD